MYPMHYSGCINDVKNIKSFFQKNYQLDEVMVLTDDKSAEPETKYPPTRANILNAFKWLIRGAKPGDSLLLHYSGHGGKVKNHDGTEASGYDQTLIPLDHAKAGHILDDDVHDALCRKLPKGTRLTAIFDCCHSETIMDLPYVYNVDGNLDIIESDKNQSVATLVSAGTRFLLDGNKKQAGKVFQKELTNLFMGSIKGGDSAADSARRKKNIENNETSGDVIMFSGCKDDQTSADANIGGQATGAMSYALVTTMKKHLRNSKPPTYTELLREMRQSLEGKYTQVPQMSAGRKLILNHPFKI
mmetsp:Transcript_18392/g.51268  ORF Transcript_18392/g.51268 Transcript_18392/m.51268 type:complete len:301 (-) Transcript_18392:752-1654(-)